MPGLQLGGEGQWGGRGGLPLRTTRCSNALQHTATHCNILQHIATCCNTLQHSARHCITLQRRATYSMRLHVLPLSLVMSQNCNTHVAYWRTLQRTLQHADTHCVCCHTLQHHTQPYKMVKTHRMNYLYRSFSPNEPYN